MTKRFEKFRPIFSPFLSILSVRHLSGYLSGFFQIHPRIFRFDKKKKRKDPKANLNFLPSYIHKIIDNSYREYYTDGYLDKFLTNENSITNFSIKTFTSFLIFIDRQLSTRKKNNNSKNERMGNVRRNDTYRIKKIRICCIGLLYGISGRIFAKNVQVCGWYQAPTFISRPVDSPFIFTFA